MSEQIQPVSLETRELRIFGVSGTFSVAFAKLGEETFEVASSTVRTPLTDNWFGVGDGRFNPSTLSIDLTLSGVDFTDAVSLFTFLVTIASKPTKLKYGQYEREVFSLKTLVKQPIANGYKVQLTFNPKTADWLDTVTNYRVYL